MTIPPQFETSDPDAWHALGLSLAALGDRVGAFNALRNAAALDGSHANTQLALGNLLFDTGRLDDALRCFDRVKNDPRS
jgi:Flp pilus assembly protein TadD